METLFSEEFGEYFFLLGTIAVLAILYFGYYKGRHSSTLSILVVYVFVFYMFGFLAYRYAIGHIGEHAASSKAYVALAILHGLISLAAVALACVIIILANRAFSRGENYFTTHPRVTLALAVLWPLALLSGYLVG